ALPARDVYGNLLASSANPRPRIDVPRHSPQAQLMHLIQVLLPLYDNDANPISPELFQRVRSELSSRYGGRTVYSQSPAGGLWQVDERQSPVHDELILFDVMTDQLDRAWRSDYRRQLEERFVQEEIEIRAHRITRLQQSRRSL